MKPDPNRFLEIVPEVWDERLRQHEKWAAPHSWGQGDCSSTQVDPLVKLAVLAEEFGEVARVLPFRPARDQEDEKHVHPLQLDVITRTLTLWTNPGETVLTPFMGVGSEVYEAVRCGRVGVGVELKPSYYRQALANLDTLDAPDTDDPNLSLFTVGGEQDEAEGLS